MTIDPIIKIIVVKRISESGKEYFVRLTEEEYQKEKEQARLRVDSWKYRNQHLSPFE